MPRDNDYSKDMTYFSEGSLPILKKKVKAVDILGEIIKANNKAKGVSEDMVRVSIRRHSEMMGEGIILTVDVCSLMKPGRAQRGERFFYRSEAGENVAKMAEALGGLLAGKCCEEYGDQHDPSEYAKAAKDALFKLLKDIEQNHRLTTATIKV